MATELGLKNGIDIRLMTLADFPQVKDFMNRNFHNAEPLSAASGEDVVRTAEMDIDKFLMENIEQGISLLALDQNNGGRLAGIVVAGAQIPSDVEKNLETAAAMEPHIWARTGVFLSEAELEANLFQRFGISQLLYSHITNVEASMRGKGLGRRLAAALMEVGRSKGFPLMAANCTSFYSARQKEALGMECVHAVAYKDYKDASGQVMFAPPAPHTHLRIMVIKL